MPAIVTENPSAAPPERRVTSRVAVVVGGSYGIGRACGEALLSDGAAVVLADCIDEVDATADELAREGHRVAAARIDTRNRGSVRDSFKEVIDRFGRLDVVVNNAAAPRTAKPFLELDVEDWSTHLSVNVVGTFLCMQEAARLMIEQGDGGRVVNIASTAGFRPLRRRAHYNASKAAVISLTETAALELAEHRITVNAVAPGATATPTQSALLAGALSDADGEYLEQVIESIPFGRRAEPAEVAAAVAFLSSEAAEYVTGQTVAVDGALSL